MAKDTTAPAIIALTTIEKTGDFNWVLTQKQVKPKGEKNAREVYQFKIDGPAFEKIRQLVNNDAMFFENINNLGFRNLCAKAALAATTLEPDVETNEDGSPKLDAQGNPIYILNPDGTPKKSWNTDPAAALEYIVTDLGQEHISFSTALAELEAKENEITLALFEWEKLPDDKARQAPAAQAKLFENLRKMQEVRAKKEAIRAEWQKQKDEMARKREATKRAKEEAEKAAATPAPEAAPAA